MRGSLPIYVPLKGEKCTVVGGGKVAQRKVDLLLNYTDKLRVVSPEVTGEIEKLGKEAKIELIKREYREGDLDGSRIVIAATDNEEVNKRICYECRNRKILVNVVDVTPLCDFYVPSIISKGDLQIAISTSAKSPAFSKIIRKYLEKKIKNFDERLLSKLQEFRLNLKKMYPDDLDKRMQMMEEVADQINPDSTGVKDLESIIEKVLK